MQIADYSTAVDPGLEWFRGDARSIGSGWRNHAMSPA
jgi:hypothetical protein